MTYEDYHNAPGLRASDLKAGAKSMAHMRHQITHGTEDKPAFAWGRLVHLAVLEPLRLLTSCALWDGARKAGKEWADWQAANRDMDPVTREQLDELNTITANVRANADCKALLDGCEFERSLAWEHREYGTGKARIDALKPSAIIDVKTTAAIDERSIDRTIFGYGYDLQLGWYEEGAEACGICKRPDQFLVFIESGPPHCVAVVKLGYDVIERGRKRAVQIAHDYTACCAAGAWPGPSAGVRVVSLPQYLIEETDLTTEVANG